MTHIPGGLIADWYGGKYLLLTAMLLGGTVSVIIPNLLSRDHFYLIATRFILGLTQGPVYPSVFAILANWVPKRERATLATLVYSAAPVGYTTAQFLYSCTHITHWINGYYFWSAATIIWGIFHVLFCYSEPATDSYITVEESVMLQEKIGPKQHMPLPWNKILRSSAVWSLLCGYSAFGMLFSFYMITVPQYLYDVVKLDRLSIISVTPFILLFISSIICGLASDLMANYEVLSLLSIRRYMAVLGIVLPFIFLAGIPYVECDQTYAFLLFAFGMLCFGSCFASIQINVLDIAQNFAGFIAALVSTAGYLIHLLAPKLIDSKADISLKQCLTKTIDCLKLITVEPTITLVLMAIMTTSVVEQAFFVDKACRVNKKFNANICDNIFAKENEKFNKEVQVVTAEFYQWNNIVGYGGQIALAFFVGAWSDKYGRKIPLMLGLLGKLYCSLMMMVNSLQCTWPVEYIIYTCTLPMVITGGEVAIFGSAFSYLADISTLDGIVLRFTILEACVLGAMSAGIALGGALFRLTNNSYMILFIVQSSLISVAIIYSGLRLHIRTNSEQRPIMEFNNVITDFFDYKHIVLTFKSIFKKRLLNRRLYLLLIILGMAFHAFQRDEKRMMYLFLQRVLNWDFVPINNFRMYQAITEDFMLLIAIPVMNKLLGWRDTVITLIGTMSYIIARSCYVLATDRLLLYIGGAFASLGSIGTPMIRSMVPKLVSVVERGKAFSVLSIADMAMPVVSATVYNQVYSAYIDTYPRAIFYTTMASHIVVLAIFLFIHFTSTRESLTHEDNQHDTENLENDDVQETP
ncbi:hypothetical protein FQA39_LY07310 [Lamprigera yunnana]|nr:hypothetical protein FQA39_LY07310 [Lamprigera yunnana]